MTPDVSVMAIIPARSGSKGVPWKNLRMLAGHPLIAWSIAVARAARRVDRVLVSTDSPEYAEVARSYGAEVPFLRPAALSGDASPDLDFILHALEWLKAHEGRLPDFLVHLRPTCPNRDPALVDEGIARILDDPSADSLISAHAVDYPPCKYLKRDADGGLSGYMGDEYLNLQRQQCPQAYQGNGYVDVYRVAGVLGGKGLYGRRKLLYLAPNPGDIDTEADFAALSETIVRDGAPPLSCLAKCQPAGPPAAEERFFPELVVFDFDGVFTDNAVHVDEHGVESVRCLRADGWGVAALRGRSVPMIILSTETNPVVAARGNKMRLEVHHGCGDKAAFLSAYLRERGIDARRVVYLGDDVNDLEAMRLVGYPVCPHDAHESVVAACRFRLKRPGGGGAVRELCDRLLQHGLVRGLSPNQTVNLEDGAPRRGHFEA